MISRLIVLITAALLGTATVVPALELKDITFTTTDAGKVVFSHNVHLQKKTRTTPNLNCKACHNSKMEKNVRYTMADMEKGKSCGMCHNGTKAFALAKCTGCHKVSDKIYKVKATGPTVFSHTAHLRTMQCNACHSRLYKTGPNPVASMADMEKGKSCGGCHDGKKSFALSECAKCHPYRDKHYAVKDAGKVTFSHKFHTGMYGCGECHPKLYIPGKGNAAVSMTGMEEQKSCGVCHDGKSAFTVKENCAKCHQI